MPLLGSHLSVAGGYYRAIQSAVELGCDCVQIFTKNNNRWQGKELTDQDVDRFRTAVADSGVSAPVAHASYLINLASPKPDLREKSIDAMVDELQRADRLGISGVVFHPGSFTTSSEAEGLDAIVDSLNQVLDRTSSLTSIPLLENTAGQGSNLGWKFEQLAYLLDQVGDSDRLGVCIDTCHAFAAGYAMGTRSAWEATVAAMEQTFGVDRIRAIHLNDSKREFGSRKDRHEHIGEGEMGLTPFRLLLNDQRFAHLPMVLETEKGERDGRPLDQINLETLRGLLE